jgi:hypothetical protein
VRILISIWLWKDNLDQLHLHHASIIPNCVKLIYSLLYFTYYLHNWLNFQTRWGIICLQTSLCFFIQIRWRVNVPLELTFIDQHAEGEKESVLSSKIKSEGLVNPCVLNIEVKSIWHICSILRLLLQFQFAIKYDLVIFQCPVPSQYYAFFKELQGLLLVL